MNYFLQARHRGENMERAALAKAEAAIAADEQQLKIGSDSPSTRIAAYLPEESPEALAGEVEFLSDWHDIG